MKILILLILTINSEVHKLDIEKFKEKYTKGFGRELVSSTEKSKLINCKQTLLESYNLNSYVKPRKSNLYLCPAISQTCCSVYDQFEMYSQWNDNHKKRVNDHLDSIRERMEIVRDLV